MKITPTQIGEYSKAISEGASKISKSAGDILKTLLLSGFVGVFGIVLFSGWENRLSFSDALKKTLSPTPITHSVLIKSWTLLPYEEFPNFWKCEKNKCVVDLDKRLEVVNVLNKLRGDTGGTRAVFSVYSSKERRLVAQTSSHGNLIIGEELWRIPLNQPGYQKNLINHQRGLCNTIVVADLPDGSILKIEAPIYGVAYLKTCPVDYQDLPYQIKGYVTIDLPITPNSEAKSLELEAKMKQAASEIEDIMGY